MKKKQADRTTKVFRRRLYLRHDSAKSVCGAGAILARAASTVYLERREGQAWGEHNRSAGREERTMIKTPAASAEKGICTGRAAPNGSKLRRFSNKAMGVAPQLFTAFGVWPRLGAGAMVNVHMRFAHRFDHQGVNDQPTACSRRGRLQSCFFRPQPIQRVAKTSKTMRTKTTPVGRTAC